MRAFKTFTAVSVLALLAVSYSASAQDLETPQDAGAATDQEIIITGSRLGRTTFESPTPVTVIGAAQIAQMGQVNLGETVQTLPQNVSKVSESNTGLSANTANFNVGANVVDLRGLNPNNGVRTLVLVNTKRFVPSTSGGAVDLNLIPSMLVKSLETVTGGASAAYGTDALAGVVNVLIDTRMKGMKAQVDYGQTFRGDGKTPHWSFAGGTGFANDRGHIVIGAEWQHTGAVGDCVYVRDWCAKSPDTFQNEQFNTPAGVGNGSPAFVRGDNGVYANYGLSTELRQAVGARSNGAAFSNLIFSGNGRSVIDFDPGKFVQGSGFGDRQGGTCTLDCSPWSEVQLRPDIKRLSLYSHAEFEFSSKLKATLEASYGTRESKISGISLGPSSGTPLYSDNAFLQGVTYFNRATGTTVPLVGAGGIVPSAATYCPLNPLYTPGNTTFIQRSTSAICNGVSQPQTGSMLVPLFVAKHFRNVPGGRSQQSTDLSTWRVMAGLEGELDILGGWKWDAYYQYGRTKQRVDFTGIRVNTFFIYALDAVDQGLVQNGVANGNIVCRATLPGPATVDTAPNGGPNGGFERLYNQANAAGCVPLNILGTNTESAAAMAYAYRDASEDFTYQQHVAAFNLSGDLVQGWAGPIGLAFGGEYRFEKGSAVHSKLPFNIFNTNSPFGNDYGGDLKILEGYVETNIPLLRDLPFARLIELNGAIRHTHQTNSDAVSGNSKTQNFQTWKISGIWDVTDWLRFRATRSRDVRAASFADLYINFPTIPKGPPTGAAINPFFPGASVNAAGGNVGPSNNILVNVAYPSNFALTPEIGDTTTVGVVFQPSGFLSGLRVAVDYYDIKIRDVILTLTSQQIVNACFFNVLCDRITDVNGVPFTSASANKLTFGTITRGANNLSSFQQQGWDVEVLYNLPLQKISGSLPGALSFRGLATITDSMKVNLGTGLPALEYRNQTGGSAFGGFTAPAKYILTGYTTYAVNGFSFTVDGKYIPKGLYDIRRLQVGSTDPATGATVTNTTSSSINDNTVASRFYVGLSGSYKFAIGGERSAELFFTIRNLFDRDPPSAASNAAGTLGPVQGNGGPTNPVFYDTLGAQWRAGVRVNF